MDTDMYSSYFCNHGCGIIQAVVCISSLDISINHVIVILITTESEIGFYLVVLFQDFQLGGSSAAVTLSHTGTYSLCLIISVFSGNV